ncbi:MAG: hypothetical protein ACTSRZ_19600 [Promethearchaeota archaeon]
MGIEMELIVNEVIEYLKASKNTKESMLRGIVKSYFIFSDKVTVKDTQEFRNAINELREIKRIYDLGRKFAENQEKKKKGKTLGMISIINNCETEEKKRKEAEIMLEIAKRTMSRRTYYRYKKLIREECGIEI